MRTIRLSRPVNFPWFQGHPAGDYTVTDEHAHLLVWDYRAAEYADLAPVAEKPEIPEAEEFEPEPEIPEEPKRPYGNATKAAWIEYALAVDKDLTAEAAGKLTRIELMSRYGERL